MLGYMKIRFDKFMENIIIYLGTYLANFLVHIMVGRYFKWFFR